MTVYRFRPHRSPAPAAISMTLRQNVPLNQPFPEAELLTDAQRAAIPATACFTGHRFIARQREDELRTRLDALLEKLYRDQGLRCFISGAALGFDMLAAECVLALRDRHQDVRLILALPCSNQTQKWTAAQCRRYSHLICMADETQVLSPLYTDSCMHQRNRYMVERSAVCIAYLTRPSGGTVVTAHFAMQRGRPLFNLADAPLMEGLLRVR